MHIPFCRQACHYCNFHFTTSLHYKNDLIAALLKEIVLQKNYLDNEIVETIYFGGGTPSLCTKEEITSILATIRSSFTIAPDAEITFETNPDDITEEKLKEWKETGINRLSIGIQSFFDEDLTWMNRAHTARQAISSLESAINRIARNPLAAPAVHQDVRRVLLKRFPYSVFYKVDAGQLLVLSCMHTRQSPRGWPVA